MSSSLRANPIELLRRQCHTGGRIGVELYDFRLAPLPVPIGSVSVEARCNSLHAKGVKDSCLARRRRAGKVAGGKRVKRAQPLENGAYDNGALKGRQDASPQVLFIEFDVA